MIRMPGKSFDGPLPPATEAQQTLAVQMCAELQVLAGDIGERNTFNVKKLNVAADFIENSLAQAGYDAIMITDTAPFRYAHYHEAEDTPDKVDCDRAARVTEGMRHVIEPLTSE